MRIGIAPFFLQALRGGARSGKTYFVRATMLSFLLLLLVSVQATWRFVAAPGLQLFSSIVGTTAFIICLAGPFYFASVVTDEKESMTLGLLKMTALRPAWILMGKSTSHMIAAALLLVAQLPLVVLAVTLGGVSMGQIVAAYCALAAHLVLTANVALLFSTISRTRGRAVAGTTASLLAFFVLPPLGRSLLQQLVSERALAAGGIINTTLGPVFRWGAESSIFTRCGQILRTGFGGSPIGFQVLTNLGGGAVFFLLAWAAFERFTQDQGAAAPGRGLLFGRRSLLRRFGAGRAWRNALAWKDYHFIVGGKAFALIKFVALGVLLFGIRLLMQLSGQRVDAGDFGGLILGVMVFAIGVQLVLYHGRLLGQERQQGTLSNLLMLPHSARAIVWRKLFGCLLGLAPDLVWLVVGAALAPRPVKDVIESLATEPTGWYFVAQYVLLLQLALYLPLLVRRGALLLAFVIWLVASYMVVPFVTVIALMGAFGSPDTFMGLMALPVIGLAVLLHILTMSRLARLAGTE
jgi:hypothetical protein